MKHITITTIILLSILFWCTFYLSRVKQNKNRKYNYTKPIPDVNTILQKEYNRYVKNIDEYRIGTPLSGYHNPNYPYSNSYRLHPQSFIPGYRQPIDGIVPDDYPSTLDSSNMMFANMKPNCHDNCMDMTTDYYSDLLNK